MLYSELAEIINGIRPVVTFKKGILDKEGYAETGMTEIVENGKVWTGM
jgi:hypothetical protein